MDITEAKIYRNNLLLNSDKEVLQAISTKDTVLKTRLAKYRKALRDFFVDKEHVQDFNPETYRYWPINPLVVDRLQYLSTTENKENAIEILREGQKNGTLY